MSQEEAFTEFLEQYKKLLIKVAGIYCSEPEERKDLVQDIVLQLWKSFGKYDPSITQSTWVYRIALNVAISYLRKKTTRKKHYQEYRKQPHVLHWEPSKIDDNLQVLYQAIARLRPIDRALILLHLDGCKNQEIATIMGITHTNVSTKLQRIKEQLKSIFLNSKS